MSEIYQPTSQSRVRANQSASLALSTSWQRIDFAGSSSYNTNTFPLGPDGVNNFVYWDAVNKLFKFQNQVDMNFIIQFNAKIFSSAVLSALSLTMATARLRLVVPAPTPIYFPLPDSDQCIDIAPLGLVSIYRGAYGFTIYANAAVRQYGIGLEVSISNSFLATAALQASDVILYQT